MHNGLLCRVTRQGSQIAGEIWIPSPYLAEGGLCLESLFSLVFCHLSCLYFVMSSMYSSLIWSHGPWPWEASALRLKRKEQKKKGKRRIQNGFQRLLSVQHYPIIDIMIVSNMAYICGTGLQKHKHNLELLEWMSCNLLNKIYSLPKLGTTYTL